MKSAIRLMVAVMGVWMGLAGVEHGIGEILQGSVIPNGLMIQSWPDSAFFHSLNGEPAMTLLPNLLLTGILTVLFSLLFTGWSVFFARHRLSGQGMMLLSIPMLLFGGGIFPPILGFLIGFAATRVPVETSPKPVSGLNQLLGRGWQWIFAACCAAWLALFPGVAVLGYFFGVDETGVILAIMAAAFCLLLLAFWSGVQHDRLELS
ncbi:MAG: hypothetical protein ABFD44_15335 [Anaerolineaceae bacterium]